MLVIFDLPLLVIPVTNIKSFRHCFVSYAFIDHLTKIGQKLVLEYKTFVFIIDRKYLLLYR